VALAREAAGRTSLVAPAAGRVTRWQVAPGDWLAIGTPVADFQVPEAFYLRLPVDELDLPKLRTGMPVAVTFDAFPDDALRGKVTRIGRVSQPTAEGAQAFPVEVAFEDPQGRARPGMNADARLVVREKQAALAIPVGAVRREGDRMVVTRLRADGKQETVPFEPGILTLDRVEVKQGLAEGDRLVLPGAAAAK
jgi:HlyD family secretion protein